MRLHDRSSGLGSILQALATATIVFTFHTGFVPGVSADETSAVRTPKIRDRLLVFRDRDGNEVPVQSARDWELRRREILHGVELAMGALPDRSALPPPDVRVRATIEGDLYLRHEIDFDIEPGDRLSADLWVPRNRPEGARFPAMVALHQTDAPGRRIVAGESASPHHQYAVELVRRGYVVIAPDYPSFGGYDWDFEADRYDSGSMKGVFNHMRCVDVLVARDDVDPLRIGAIGHSLGGHNAIFLGAFDRRVGAVVTSCGWCPFHEYYGGKIAGWSGPRYMPRLRELYDLDPDRVPFDFYELVASIAPRGFFTNSPIGDANFDVGGVRRAMPIVAKVWELLDAPEGRLEARYPEVGHDFPTATRVEAYRFLDRVLEHDSADPRSLALPSPAAGTVWSGTAFTDITPPVGGRLSGYFHDRRSTGVHDRLFAKAIFLGDSGASMAFVLCDLIGIPVEVSRKARDVASERTGIPAENIVVAATHSHTGPLYFGALRELFHAQAIAAEGQDSAEPFDYAERLVEQIVDAVERARALARPVRVGAAIGAETRLSFHRRFLMKGGGVRFNPGKLNPEIERPVGPTDPEFGVITLRDPVTSRPLSSWTTFALHLDTVGGTELAADFPHYLSESLRQRFGAGFFSTFAAAPCGDINHIDVSHDRTQGGHGEARRIGQALAQSVETAITASRELEPRLGVAVEVARVPLQRYDEAAHAEARRRLEPGVFPTLPFLEQVEAYKIWSLELIGESTIELEAQAFRLSQEVAIVALPGEIFVELGLAIRRRSPFRTTIIIELANDDTPEYIPTRRGFAEGAYEAVNSRVAPGGGEALVEAALRALERLDP
jgi:neutral ceramidase